jgi:hypothetical protein
VIVELDDEVEVRWSRQPWQVQGHVSTIRLTADVIAYALRTQPVSRNSRVAVEHLRPGDPMLDAIEDLDANDLTVAFHHACGRPTRWRS